MKHHADGYSDGRGLPFAALQVRCCAGYAAPSPLAASVTSLFQNSDHKPSATGAAIYFRFSCQQQFARGPL
eukprot:68172-Prorocentrum_minimum.AAC.1